MQKISLSSAAIWSLGSQCLKRDGNDDEWSVACRCRLELELVEVHFKWAPCCGHRLVWCVGNERRLPGQGGWRAGSRCQSIIVILCWCDGWGGDGHKRQATSERGAAWAPGGGPSSSIFECWIMVAGSWWWNSKGGPPQSEGCERASARRFDGRGQRERGLWVECHTKEFCVKVLKFEIENSRKSFNYFSEVVPRTIETVR